MVNDPAGASGTAVAHLARQRGLGLLLETHPHLVEAAFGRGTAGIGAPPGGPLTEPAGVFRAGPTVARA